MGNQASAAISFRSDSDQFLPPRHFFLREIET